MLLLAWRQNEEVIRYLPSHPRVLTWEEHMAWWGNSVMKRDRKEKIDRMILFRDTEIFPVRPVGIVTANIFSGEVGILIGDVSVWGQGIGKAAVGEFLALLRAQGRRKDWWAVIHPLNTGSQNVFLANGFNQTEEMGRNGQGVWRLAGDSA